MYIDSCKTGKYTRHLLRESYRQDGKVSHRTIGNLSHCTDKQIEAIQQWVVGLLCDGDGRPLTVEVFKG